jgi:predicted RNA-binding protein associated with RNAse of E/G family
VVRDDPDVLVVWLSVGTPVTRLVRVDGLNKRADPGTLFTAPVVASPGLHELYDQVRVVPAGRAWSAWAMFAADSGISSAWYVNFERPHQRDAWSTYTSDHVLDLWVEPDRTVVRKDEDELALAVEQGALDAATADATLATCLEVEAIVASWGSPFCDGWEHLRPWSGLDGRG